MILALLITAVIVIGIFWLVSQKNVDEAVEQDAKAVETEVTAEVTKVEDSAKADEAIAQAAVTSAVTTVTSSLPKL